MAKLTATTYDDLIDLLVTKKNREAVIGNNTMACMELNDGGGFGDQFMPPKVSVALHGTVIVVLYADGSVVFSLAGYPTVTTRERVNQFLPSGYRVIQRGGVQFLMLPNGTDTEITAYGNYHVSPSSDARIAVAS